MSFNRLSARRPRTSILLLAATLTAAVAANAPAADRVVLGEYFTNLY